MSNLVTLFDALSKKTVIANGVTPNVYDIDELVNRIDTADLPARFLSEIEGGTFELFHLGVSNGKTNNQITWTIQDKLLWRPVGLGGKRGEAMADLAEYAANYAEMLREMREPASCMVLDDVSIVVGRIEWPEQTGQFYLGCTVVLTVKEQLVS